MRDLNNILERVLALFKRYGIRSVTMDDISSELGMSKKTLYQEFKDKDDLMNQVIVFDMAQSRRLLEEVNQSYTDAIHELFMLNRGMHSARTLYSPTFYFDLRRYYPQIYARWMEDKRSNMYRVITDNLKKGKREGLYRAEIDEHIIGRLHIARVEMLEANDLIEDHELMSKEFIQEVFSYHLHGICNERGLKLFAREWDNFKQ